MRTMTTTMAATRIWLTVLCVFVALGVREAIAAVGVSNTQPACANGICYFPQIVVDGGAIFNGAVTFAGGANDVAPIPFNAYYDGQVIAASDVVVQNRFDKIVTGVALSFTPTKAGGDGAHTFTVDVFDLTSSTVLCVTGTIACNVAAGTVTRVACSTASNVASDDLQLRVNDSACITVSLGNVSWLYR